VAPRRLLGIDYGERRIGVAISEGRVAVPLTIVEHKGRAAGLERVAGIAREQGAEAVIVGLPLLASGEEGAQARRCRRFGEALVRLLDAPVRYQDETLTSVSAETSVRELAGARRGRGRGRRLDDVAAANILQAFIDEQPERGAREPDA
jgi:putative Holliday junction resolvase